jgi:hypothetical protein
MVRWKISLARGIHCNPISFITSFARPASLHWDEHVCIYIYIHTHTHIFNCGFIPLFYLGEKRKQWWKLVLSSEECGLSSLALVHEIRLFYNPPHTNTGLVKNEIRGRCNQFYYNLLNRNAIWGVLELNTGFRFKDMVTA